MEITLTTPALLFSTLSLLLLAYTNRFLALSTRIRSLYDRYRHEQASGVRQQIASLLGRVRLIRLMQLLGILSLLCCVVCMFFLFEGWFVLGKWVFAASLVLLMASLVVSAMEIFLSTRALDIELHELWTAQEPLSTCKKEGDKKA
jgi:peptidoglycan/LPS O-acetylase OafA/YrhL